MTQQAVVERRSVARTVIEVPVVCQRVHTRGADTAWSGTTEDLSGAGMAARIDCGELAAEVGDVIEADLSIEQLVKTATSVSVGERYADWERVIEMLESELMPPSEASIFPEAAERAAALTWIRGALRNYEEKYAGAPGRVTVRRLTSAEYRYAIRDLTGLDLDVGIDASSDAVGSAFASRWIGLPGSMLPTLGMSSDRVIAPMKRKRSASIFRSSGRALRRWSTEPSTPSRWEVRSVSISDFHLS